MEGCLPQLLFSAVSYEGLTMQDQQQQKSTNQPDGKKSKPESFSDPMQRYLSGSPKDDPWNALGIPTPPKKNKTKSSKRKSSQNKA